LGNNVDKVMEAEVGAVREIDVTNPYLNLEFY